jgi:hypothetical protein
MIVLLDTGPLGLVTNPRATTQNVACRLWATNLASAGVRVLVPEIADYELRRELIRVNRQRGIAYLDRLGATGGYVLSRRRRCGGRRRCGHKRARWELRQRQI